MPIETGASSYFWGDLGAGFAAPGYYVTRISDEYNRSCPGCCRPETCLQLTHPSYGGTSYMGSDLRLRLPATLPGYYWTGDYISKYAWGIYWDGGRWELWEIDIYGTSPDTKVKDLGTDPSDPTFDDGTTTVEWPVDCGGTTPTTPTGPTSSPPPS